MQENNFIVRDVMARLIEIQDEITEHLDMAKALGPKREGYDAESKAMITALKEETFSEQSWTKTLEKVLARTYQEAYGIVLWVLHRNLEVEQWQVKRNWLRNISEGIAPDIVKNIVAGIAKEAITKGQQQVVMSGEIIGSALARVMDVITIYCIAAEIAEKHPELTEEEVHEKFNGFGMYHQISKKYRKPVKITEKRLYENLQIIEKLPINAD